MSLAAQTHEGRSEPRVQYSKEATGPNRYISRASQLLLHYGTQRRGDGSPAQWGVISQGWPWQSPKGSNDGYLRHTCNSFVGTTVM